MKKILLMLLILTMLLFVVSCDKKETLENNNDDISSSVEDTSTAEETSSTEESSTDDISSDEKPPLTRKDKVVFASSSDYSVIMAQNENGDEYIAYGYNDSTYRVMISYNSLYKEELKSLLNEFIYNFHEFKDSSIILDELQGEFIIYFRSFNVYKEKQEELLNLLSSLEYVEKISVRALRFGKHSVNEGYDFVTVEQKIDKEYILLNYEDFEKISLKFEEGIEETEITEETFENNIVVVVRRNLGGIYSELSDDKYYNFQHENGKIYLTYNHDFWGRPCSDQLWDTTSFVIIPRKLIKDIEKISAESEVIVLWRIIDNSTEYDQIDTN